MERIRDLWDSVRSVANLMRDLFTNPIFSIGDTGIDLGTLLYISIAFTLLFYITKRIKNGLIRRLLSKTHLDKGTAVSVGTITRFTMVFLGSIIIVQSAGIDLSTLGLLAGALGIGIGFGLQSIADNFISGIIILFEKPVKVGDRIQVGDIEGDVTNISVRATTVLTNDNISIIVPNSEFISQSVINWTNNDRNIRYRIPVGVSYNEDPTEIREVLLLVANRSSHVLSKPEPIVIFEEYGESSLNFELAVWTSSHTSKPRILKSELYFEIFNQFKTRGIEIPFPQRDLHIKGDGVSNRLN